MAPLRQLCIGDGALTTYCSHFRVALDPLMHLSYPQASILLLVPLCKNMALPHNAYNYFFYGWLVKPPIKDTPKKDKRTNQMYHCIQTLYKITSTSERGQPTN